MPKDRLKTPSENEQLVLAAASQRALIMRYETLRKRMQKRIDEVGKSYKHIQPLNQLFALLHDDPELELLDKELCELERLLPESYQFDAEV